MNIKVGWNSMFAIFIGVCVFSQTCSVHPLIILSLRSDGTPCLLFFFGVCVFSQTCSVHLIIILVFMQHTD